MEEQQKGKKRRSIRNRLNLLLLIIFLPIFTLQVYTYYESFQDRSEAELQANLEMARGVAKAFESFVQDILNQELVIGLAITSSRGMLASDINRLLLTSKEYAAIREFTWMNPEGVAVYSSNPDMLGRNYSDRPYFRDIANGREWTVGELVLAKTTGKPVFGISRGIRDEKGILLGVVVGTVVPEKLDARLAIERKKGGGFALVDQKGMMVYRYPAIHATWEERNWLRQYPEFEESLKGREIAKKVYAPFEGKDRLVAFTPVSSIGWAASAGTREENVIWTLVGSTKDNAFLFLLVSSAAFLAALVFARKIERPVAELSAHAVAIGNGQEAARHVSPDISEFDALAESFNTMAEKVRARETALRESEERYRGVVQNTSAVILRVDPQGIVRFANERALQFFGYSAEELIGNHAVGTIVPERESTGRDLAAMVDGIAENPDRYHSNANENMRKNGERVWMEWTNSGIYDAGGKLKEFLSVGIDATERKRAEEAADIAHRQIQSIIDNTTAHIYALDLEGRFVMANAALAELLNSTPEQMIGKRRHEFMPKEDADWHEANDHKAVQAGEALDFEEYSQLKGRSITWLTTKVPLRDAQGRIYAVAGISADVSERKQAEKTLKEAKETLEQRVRERTMDLLNLTEQLEQSRHELRKLASELVISEERERKRIAGVLHDEIAQTLAAARMRLDLLQSIPSDQKDKQTLQDVKAFLVQSIQETRALMNDLGNPVLFDLGLKAACETLANRLMEIHPVRISCDIPDAYKHLDPDVKAIVFQVVRELLNNIAKHSQAQNARVMIDTEDGHFRVQVTDDGIGFDSRTLGTPTNEGGFGLYSIRERLIAMNGSLKIESAPGTGTAVTAVLPAVLD